MTFRMTFLFRNDLLKYSTVKNGVREVRESPRDKEVTESCRLRQDLTRPKSVPPRGGAG